jgi:isopenicillin N synthase-like dioxygenase
MIFAEFLLGYQALNSISIIDISPLRAANRDPAAVTAMAAALSAACRTHGFFFVSGHGVATELIGRIEAQSMEFFSLSEEEKMRIAMEKGGRAWRGYFPVGGELTSGYPT